MIIYLYKILTFHILEKQNEFKWLLSMDATSTRYISHTAGVLLNITNKAVKHLGAHCSADADLDQFTFHVKWPPLHVSNCYIERVHL